MRVQVPPPGPLKGILMLKSMGKRMTNRPGLTFKLKVKDIVYNDEKQIWEAIIDSECGRTVWNNMHSMAGDTFTFCKDIHFHNDSWDPSLNFGTVSIETTVTILNVYTHVVEILWHAHRTFIPKGKHRYFFAPFKVDLDFPGVEISE